MNSEINETKTDYQNLLNLVCSNVRKYRTEQKLSIQDLAKLTGISERYIKRIEKIEIKNIALTKMLKIADALNIPLTSFTKDL